MPAASRLVSILRALAVTAAITVCAVLAVSLPALWKSGGRDIMPCCATMALLVFALAILMRAGARWPVVDLLVGLAGAELFALIVVGHFSGFSGLRLLDAFNLNWWFGVSTFIAIPWVVGLLVGNLLLRARRRAS